MNVANTFILLHQIILIHIKTIEMYSVSFKKILQKKIVVLEEQNRID